MKLTKILLTSALAFGFVAAADAAPARPAPAAGQQAAAAAPAAAPARAHHGFRYYQGTDWNHVPMSVFNPAFRPTAGMFTVTGGASFMTGPTSTENGHDSFKRGQFGVDEFSVSYGIMDQLFVWVSVDDRAPFGPQGRMSNLEAGVNWQVIRPAKSFALDIIGKVGPTWTVDLSGANYGMNNLQLGARIYGDEGRFQWALTGLGQMAFANSNADFLTDDSLLWGALFKAEMEFEFTNCTGIKLEGTYNMLNVNSSSGERRLHQGSVLLGLVHNVKPRMAIMPYVAYDFASYHGSQLNDNAWRFGAKVGVKF